jgi:hypothetical protein
MSYHVKRLVPPVRLDLYPSTQTPVDLFGTSHPVDSSIDVFFDADNYSAVFVIPSTADMSPDNEGLAHNLLESDRLTRLRGPPARFEDNVAHVSTVPRACVTNASSPYLCEQEECDLVADRDFSMMVAHPRHESAGGPVAHVALVSARVCVEPASYQATLVSLQSAEWQKAKQPEFDSLASNQTWDLVPLPAGRRVMKVCGFKKLRQTTLGPYHGTRPGLSLKAATSARGSI